MRVLVTGVSGFAGSFVANALALANFAVVGVHRRQTTFLARLSKVAAIELVCADVANVANLPGPFDAVVHVAATSPAPAIRPEEMIVDNVQATSALVGAAKAWRCRSFVFFSSISLYGTVARSVLDEDSPIVNPDVYGATKILSECLLADDGAQLPGLALRLPGVLGPGAHRNWLSRVASRLLVGQTIEAFCLNAPFNNAAHIADVSALIVTVLRRGWTGFDAVVLGARGTITVHEAINRLAKGLGVTPRVQECPAPKSSFTISSQRAIDRWGYDPMEIGCLLDRYAGEVRASVQTENLP